MERKAGGGTISSGDIPRFLLIAGAGRDEWRPCWRPSLNLLHEAHLLVSESTSQEKSAEHRLLGRDVLLDETAK